jgi:outer membrane protein W
MTRRRISLLLLLICAMPLAAADVEVGIHHLGTMFMGESESAAGELQIATSRGFGISAELFWSERVSTQLAGTFLNPETILFPASGPVADVDMGTLGLDIWSLDARYHFAPRGRLSPLVGGGVALVSPGNLEDRFGDAIEMEFDTETAFFVEGGVRFRFRPRVIFDVTLSYMPVDLEPSRVRNDSSNPAIVLPTAVNLDPLTLNFGAAWRF